MTESGRWRGSLRAGAAHHLARRRRSVGVVVVGGAVGPAFSLPGSGGSGGALVAATALLVLIQLAGTVGGEIRSGRAVLGVGAAGSVTRWLALELLGRLAALALALGAMWLLAAALVLPRPGAAAALLRSVPFLGMLTLIVASVAYACSALADRLDSLLASLYLVPVTLAVVGITAMRGEPGHPLTLTAVPVDALLAFAPGGAGAAAPPAAAVRIGAFVMAWWLAGWIAARLRIAATGVWPRG